MANFLPSKMFILILAILASGAGGFWLYKSQPWRQPILSYDANSRVSGEHDASSIDADKDSDADGLKDWQENLFRLDPLNPDSDKNGILDGDENLDSIIIPSPTESGEGGGNEPLGHRFLTDALTGYFALKSSGLNDEAIFKILMQKYEDEYLESDLLQDSYDEKEVLTVADSPVAIREYANEAARIIDRNFKNIDKNEMELIYEMSQTENYGPETAARFIDYQEAYSGTAGEFKDIAVPSSYASLHSELINSLQNTATMNSAFSAMTADPLTAFFYFNSYKKESERFQKIMSGFAGQFLEDNINFTPDDFGSMFTYYSAKSN